MRFAGALVLILLVNEACASEPPRLCADPRGLSIHGVLADNVSTVVAKLGEPKRVGSYEGEDDGGVYTGRVLVYPQLEVNLDELRGIERIASLGPGARLPYGLKVGMSLEQTADILHFIQDGVDEDEGVVLPVCRSDADAQVRLQFEHGALKRIEVVEYGP